MNLYFSYDTCNVTSFSLHLVRVFLKHHFVNLSITRSVQDLVMIVYNNPDDRKKKITRTRKVSHFTKNVEFRCDVTFLDNASMTSKQVEIDAGPV